MNGYTQHKIYKINTIVYNDNNNILSVNNQQLNKQILQIKNKKQNLYMLINDIKTFS